MKVPLDAVSAAHWRAIDEGAAVYVRDDAARWRITGTGRDACVQGLVTSDIAKLAPDSIGFSALLTSKGMIVTPLWITREADALIIEAPRRAEEVVDATFARTLPPRLCKWENITATRISLGLYGPKAAPFPGALPAVARGAAGFDGDIDASDATLLVDELVRMGAVRVPAALMESCRILAGIPALGAEIDEKTLPQEVRLEELGAISYTKGCYVGQETVARLHFRGHANRRLTLVVLDDEPSALPHELQSAGRAVGRLTSACWSTELDTWVGQALVRREVADGEEVDIGEAKAVIRADRWLRAP